jgi:hypothetical protein
MAPRAAVIDDVAVVAVFLAQALAAPQAVMGTTAVVVGSVILLSVIVAVIGVGSAWDQLNDVWRNLRLGRTSLLLQKCEPTSACPEPSSSIAEKVAEC